MGSEEEVVIVAQDGHGHIPGQIQEGLHGGRERKIVKVVTITDGQVRISMFIVVAKIT